VVRPGRKVQFARLIQRPGRVLGGPAVRAAFGGNLKACPGCHVEWCRTQADTQPPAVEDAARLLRAAAAEDPELGLFLRLAVVLGARRGELCALRWSEVDLDQGEVLIAGAVVRVPKQSLLAKPTKTHAKRRVAVGDGTVELLRARRIAQAKDALACGTTLAADAYVFSHVPDGSAPLDPDGISHRFQRLARRLGVRCRLHDLRHFMVTQLVAGGVDWRTVLASAFHEVAGGRGLIVKVPS
jgi:integrase